MRVPITTALAALLTCVPVYAAAQEANWDRWQWEVRTELAAPTRSPRNVNLDTGVGFQGTVSYSLVQGFGIYAGLDLSAFEANRSFAGDDVVFMQSGGELGVEWRQGFPNSNLGLRLRAGAIYGKISIYDDIGDDEIADSNHGLGWEFGIALEIGLPNKWVLTPGIRYRELSRNVTLNGVSRGIDLETVNFGMGFGRTF